MRLAIALLLLLGCASRPPFVADLNHAPGELVDIDAFLVEGAVTIVDFHADWCAACDRIEAMLLSDLASSDDIVIRRVDVGAGRTPVARAYNIGVLPHLRLFDTHRRLRYVLVGNDTLRTAELARSLAAE
jgi:thiol-disulfide isomerase/thioredoxin